MNRNEMILRCVHYVLSQDCDREAVVNDLTDDYMSEYERRKKLGLLNELRQIMRTQAMDTVWYCATVLRDGKREANKAVTIILNEVFREWENV